MIADLRDKEYLKSEEQAEKEGIKTQYKDLQGYPVASLDAPEVVGLKTATRVHSAITWPVSFTKPWAKDLAAPGYRKAAELRPNTPLLEQALVNLDKPSKSDDSDILIVVQSGLAPARDSIRVPLPLPISNNVVITRCRSRSSNRTPPPRLCADRRRRQAGRPDRTEQHHRHVPPRSA